MYRSTAYIAAFGNLAAVASTAFENGVYDKEFRTITYKCPGENGGVYEYLLQYKSVDAYVKLEPLERDHLESMADDLGVDVDYSDENRNIFSIENMAQLMISHFNMDVQRNCSQYRTKEEREAGPIQDFVVSLSTSPYARLAETPESKVGQMEPGMLLWTMYTGKGGFTEDIVYHEFVNMFDPGMIYHTYHATHLPLEVHLMESPVVTERKADFWSGLSWTQFLREAKKPGSNTAIKKAVGKPGVRASTNPQPQSQIQKIKSESSTRQPKQEVVSEPQAVAEIPDIKEQAATETVQIKTTNKASFLASYGSALSPCRLRPNCLTWENFRWFLLWTGKIIGCIIVGVSAIVVIHICAAPALFVIILCGVCACFNGDDDDTRGSTGGDTSYGGFSGITDDRSKKQKRADARAERLADIEYERSGWKSAENRYS